MRFKAILAELARKRYPLSILMFVVGVLMIPFCYLFVHYGLELTSNWWTFLSIGAGLLLCCVMIGLGSLVEDIHDISMHTVGYDLEMGEMMEEEEPEESEPAEAADSESSEAEKPEEHKAVKNTEATADNSRP